MALVLWVDEVFNFSHRKLAHAEETCARRDFVTERAPDLSRREWHAPVVEFEQAREIEEVALRGLGAEVALRE